jgi:hypothetical protein
MENFRFDITARGDLTAAMTVAFSWRRTALFYSIHEPTAPLESGGEGRPRRLIFYWRAESGQDLPRLPLEADAPAAAELARLWLAKAEYGPEPYHDGTSSKGWRVYNEERAIVDGHWGAICAVTPVWARHHQ